MFEFLFKYPLAAFRKGEFALATGWPLWLLALLVALGCGLVAWLARRERSRLAAKPGLAVLALQCLSVALVLTLLWQPALVVQSLKSHQNVVAVLVDASRSMAFGEDGVSRLQRSSRLLAEQVLPGLKERFRVRLYGFGAHPERLESLAPEHWPEPRPSSAVGESVLSVLRESTAVPLGAVVVVSDGSDTTQRFDRDLLAEIRQYNVPVHTVGVGRDRIAGDIELAAVRVASESLPQSRVSARMTIRHDGQRDLATRVTVRDGSELLASRAITLRAGEPVRREWVDFGAGDAGVRNLSFSVEPVAGEEIRENNTRRRVLDVPRGRRRILYAEGEPRWQYKFMRRAVHRDASVQLVTLLRTSVNKYYRQGVDTPEELEDGFPADEEGLFAYDALIVGSFEAAFFTPQQQVAMREFVSRRGGALMMLAGPNGLGAGGWHLSELVDALPSELVAGEESFQRERVKVELTTQGREALVCRLHPDPGRSAELWAELPELADFQRLGDLKPAAVPLLGVRHGRDLLPLLVRQNYGRGRTVILATGGSWRWRMSLPSDDVRHDTFWRQLLRSLVAASEGPVRLTSDRPEYADDSRMLLRAEVRGKDYRHANNAQVTAVVTPEVGEPLSVDLAPAASAPGVYEAEVEIAAAGAYRIEAAAYSGDERLGADTLHVRRESGVAEFFRPERNRDLLVRLADRTGGRYWELGDAAQLPREIRFSQAGITAREVLDLWDMPALFLLLLALRGGEWALRKRWGVI